MADSTDDGAAYAVAQSVRSTIGALTTANQQLGNVQGLLSTTQSGLNDISNTMASMRDVLVKLSDANVSGDQRTQYIRHSTKSLLANVKTFIQDAGYNGKTLIGNITGSSGTFIGRVATVRNEAGASYGIATFGGIGAVYARSTTVSLPMGTGAPAAPLQPAVASASALRCSRQGHRGGSFITQMNNGRERR